MKRWRKHCDESQREHEENRCKSDVCWMNAEPLGNIPAIISSSAIIYATGGATTGGVNVFVTDQTQEESSSASRPSGHEQ